MFLLRNFFGCVFGCMYYPTMQKTTMNSNNNSNYISIRNFITFSTYIWGGLDTKKKSHLCPTFDNKTTRHILVCTSAKQMISLSEKRNGPSLEMSFSFIYAESTRLFIRRGPCQVLVYSDHILFFVQTSRRLPVIKMVTQERSIST